MQCNGCHHSPPPPPSCRLAHLQGSAPTALLAASGTMQQQHLLLLLLLFFIHARLRSCNVCSLGLTATARPRRAVAATTAQRRRGDVRGRHCLALYDVRPNVLWSIESRRRIPSSSSSSPRAA